MAITTCTIAGVDFDALQPSLDINEAAAAISTLVCEVVSVGSPVYRPGLHDEIILEEDGVRVFAGHLTQVRERGFGGPNLYDEHGAPQIVTTITAEDYSRLADRVYVDETTGGSPGVSLEAFLTTLVTNYFTGFGVTLDAAQATGPDLPAMDFDLTIGSDVLNKLSEATGYTWRIDYSKTLRMWLPGELVAPFDVNESDDPARWTGDVEVERILGDTYANSVTVKVGPITELNRVETFYGDGVTSTFALTYTPTRLPGLIHRFDLNMVASGGETFGVPPDAPLQWSYDSATNTITRDIGASEAGYIYQLTFDGVFETSATASDAADIAAHGLWEYVTRRTDIFSTADAQTIAAALLAERLQAGDTIVRYETRYPAPSLHVGQQQTITAPSRGVSGAHTITEIRTRAETPVTALYAASGFGFIRTVTAKLTQIVEGKWQATYRDWLGLGAETSTAPVISSGPGVVVASGPSPPDTSVQFNNAGIFGGDEAFTFTYETDSVVCGGGGSSITASDVESCQVFGYNNHITN